MELLKFIASDTATILQLAHETIRSVNSADYTAAQCDAWIAGMSDVEAYKRRLGDSYTLVAHIDSEIVGFVNLEADGHIDNIYVRTLGRGTGIGRMLLEAVEKKARENGNTRLFAEVSVTAKTFFESKGYAVIHEQFAPYRGEVFRRFEMEKELS